MSAYDAPELPLRGVRVFDRAFHARLLGPSLRRDGPFHYVAGRSAWYPDRPQPASGSGQSNAKLIKGLGGLFWAMKRTDFVRLAGARTGDALIDKGPRFSFLSMDPNRYAVSEPELLRTLRLSERGGFLRDHPGIATFFGTSWRLSAGSAGSSQARQGTRASILIVTRC